MRKLQNLLIGLMLTLLLLGNTITAMAEENGEYNIRDGEVVFLLDTSVSMNKQNKDRSALDAVRQGAYGLPSNYSTGMVAYNTGIQTVVPLGTDIGLMEQQLETIEYTGYTNAGDGLDQAMKLFTDREEVDRFIIMLSDGEIDMPDIEAKEQSRRMYSEAANRAKQKGVKIFIIAIGSELGDPVTHIFDGAELTDGAIYWEGQSGSLSQIMERILHDRMEFPKQELSVDESGQIHTKISGGASRVKVLVAAGQDLSEVSAVYSAEDGRTITGKRFALIDMIRPTSESLDIGFQFEDGAAGPVKAYLLTEYTVTPQVTTKYRIEEIPRTEKEIRKNVPPEYKHYVDIVIEMVDAAGEYGNIWGIALDGTEVNFMVNNEPFIGILQQGKVMFTRNGDDYDEVEVTIDTTGLGAIYNVRQPVTSKVNKIPDPVFEPLPDYRPLWAIIGILSVALVILVIMWVKKKNTTIIYMAPAAATKEPSVKAETKASTYSGKLNLYMVRTMDGRDIPPQTYRLFGRKGGRQTINQILTTCGIKLGKIGADDIAIYPAPDHAFIIVDQSEGCTIMKGTEILRKNMGYPVFYNEKLIISFDDEVTEMEVHYKNLKPSEREEI